MMSVDWYKEVLQRKESLLEDLTKILRIPSVKDLSNSDAENPMGKEIGEALTTMLEISKQSGFRVKNIDGYAGYAEYGTGDEYIGVLGHLDVVPATGEWTSPPFEPTIREGKLYARGAIDDKGPTLAAFYGLKIVKELGLPLKHRVRLILGTDEESGMSCMKKYVEVEPAPIAGFAPDADFPMIHAEKGQINAKLALNEDLKTDNGEFQLLSFASGDRVNMVPGLAEAVLTGINIEQMEEQFKQFCEANKLVGKTELKGTSLLLTLKGKQVHGMEPQNGINAGTSLATFLKDYDWDEASTVYLRFLARLHQDYYGINLGINFSDEITGPLTVNIGIMHYKLGEEASALLNIRCPVKTNYDQTIENLCKTAAELRLNLANHRTSRPHHVEKNHPLIQALQKVYQEETGDEPTLLTSGGATYAKFMENGVAFGACFPGKEMTAHQVDEYIDVDDLLKATAIYARAIYELGNL
jgi:succinyl-diaminopimelate desuccinylase